MAGLSLLRRAVASCAAVVRGAPNVLPTASAAAVALPPLVMAVAPALVVDLAAEVASPGNAGAPSLPRIYEVREGDTLWAIALRTYGEGRRYVDILAANPGARCRARMPRWAAHASRIRSHQVWRRRSARQAAAWTQAHGGGCPSREYSAARLSCLAHNGHWRAAVPPCLNPV